MSDVTAVGDETGGAAAETIWAAARHWYAGGTQPAIQICVRHRGDVVLDRAIGNARGPVDPVTTTTPFRLFSASKAVAAIAVWRLIDTGRLQLSDRVADLVPGYGSRGKGATTVDHVLTHRAGVPFAIGGTADLLRADDRGFVREALRRTPRCTRRDGCTSITR